MILEQLKGAVGSLTDEEQADLTVMAVTMDPEFDTPEILTRLARGQQVSTPLYNFLTGDPEKVNRILDRMGIERKRNPETNVIDHVNLFIVIDRKGTVAFRFTLGDTQERWLADALRLVIRESDSTP
jgi:protein SCO1/2